MGGQLTTVFNQNSMNHVQNSAFTHKKERLISQATCIGLDTLINRTETMVRESAGKKMGKYTLDNGKIAKEKKEGCTS
jgi:putative cell wall-binding protein